MSAALVVPAFSSCAGSERKRTAVVVGAGIAGLSAAYDLRKAGFDVTIMEKWDFVGGRMRDAQMGPLHLMPHALGVLEANAEMFALADELGIRNQLEGDKESDAYVVENGHGQYQTALRFIVDEVQRIPGLSSETARRIPLLQPDLDEIRANVNPCLVSTGVQYDDETVAAYYERKLGKDAAREVLDNWIDVVLQAWGWPSAETSRIAILSWLAQQQALTVTPKGGIGVLTRKLGDVMPVRTQTTVRYITPPDASGRHTIHYLNSRLERLTVTPDVVVCATEGKFIPELVQGLSPKQSHFFRSIDFTKAVGVSFIISDDMVPDKPVGGAYIPAHPDPIKRRVSGWSIQPAGVGHPDNPATANISLSRNEAFAWQASGESQPDYCLPFLKSLHPALDESRIRDAVTRGCDDLIYMPLGYIRTMTDVLREQEKERRGLYFAGEYMACPSSEHLAQLAA
ncbi:FAD-dependent oxidoreductase [Sphingosinicella microcystinivorans]|uniref:FAD-dependent oxidoreductase n=1 Tax=Sphingosinicella microcystinivorans TaxID=335406 RepID=UPI0022F3A952|nr:FAD-dependent oxidoreductase [Sphingosinicella microcystinivorans]WBX85214.1 FAD-dependent oxidoreductase [Sphingosinicella microcystinivorans]